MYAYIFYFSYYSIFSPHSTLLSYYLMLFFPYYISHCSRVRFCFLLFLFFSFFYLRKIYGKGKKLLFFFFYFIFLVYFRLCSQTHVCRRKLPVLNSKKTEIFRRRFWIRVNLAALKLYFDIEFSLAYIKYFLRIEKRTYDNNNVFNILSLIGQNDVRLLNPPDYNKWFLRKYLYFSSSAGLLAFYGNCFIQS